LNKETKEMKRKTMRHGKNRLFKESTKIINPLHGKTMWIEYRQLPNGIPYPAIRLSRQQQILKP
jgi:hypothetical protein